MTTRDLSGSIERLRGLGETIDRAVFEARLRRAELLDRHTSDELRELRRLVDEQTRRQAEEE